MKKIFKSNLGLYVSALLMIVFGAFIINNTVDYFFSVDQITNIIQHQKAQLASITRQNPRLFFSKDDLPKIRQSAVFINAYKNYYKDLAPMDFTSTALSETDKSNRVINLAYNLLVLDPNDSATTSIATQIRQGLLNINNGLWNPYSGDKQIRFNWDGSNDVMQWHPGGVIQNYAMAYDFMVGLDYLTGAEKEKVRSRLLLLTALEYKKLMNSNHSENNLLRIANMRFRSLGGIGMTALAIPDQAGNVPDPENLLGGKTVSFNSSDVLKAVVDDLLFHDNSMSSNDDSHKGALYNYITSDGAYTEGQSYISDSFNVLLPFMLSYQHITGQDFLKAGGLTDGRILKMFDWVIKTAMPNNLTPTFDSGFMFKLWYPYDVLAQYSNYPGEYYWYFKNISNNATTFVNRIFLLNSQDIQATTPTFRTEFFPESGNAVFRDKWGTDATYMMFLAEHDPNRSSHEQADQTSFAIYAKEAYLAIDPGDGRYYPNARVPTYNGGPENWMHSALGHNLILVDSANVSSDKNYLVSAHPNFNHYYSIPSDPAYLQNSFASDRLDFSEARMTYSGLNVDLVRSIVFPRHQYFVVFDDLRAETSHDYRWQIHFGSSPETVSADHLDQNQKDNKFTWTMKNAKGSDSSLDVNFLKGPETYNIKNDGPTSYDIYQKTYNHTYIQAVSNKKDHNYLTLLYPRYATDQSLKIEKLSSEKAWKITGPFPGYDILINQNSSGKFTVDNITTDARFALISFSNDSTPTNFIVKYGTSLIISGSKTCTFSFDSNQVFHKDVDINSSDCSIGTRSISSLNANTNSSSLSSSTSQTSYTNTLPPSPQSTNTQNNLVPTQIINSTNTLGEKNKTSISNVSITPEINNQSKVPTNKISTNLVFGSRGAQVKLLQQVLVKEKLLTPNLATGYYGTLTELAVKNLQKKYNIVSSGTPKTTGYGVVGKKTIVLVNALNTNSSTTPNPSTSLGVNNQTTTSGSKITTNLSIGSRNPQVKTLQTILVQQNLLSPKYVTGYYGPITQTAVQKLQSKYNVVSTGTPKTTGYGVVGPKTRKVVNSI